MKKVLTILIGMVLVLSLVCCVSAVEITANSVDKTAPTTVKFTIDKSYTVSIPPEITISSTDGRGNNFFTAKINQIEVGKYLNVVIKTGVDAEDYYNDTALNGAGAWVMKHADDEIPFLVGAGENVEDHIGGTHPTLKPNNGVMSLHADVNGEKVVVLHCMIPNFDDIKDSVGDYAGIYEGKLIFDVSIGESPLATDNRFIFV